MNECYPIIVDAHGDTKEEAWSNFRSVLKTAFKFIRGHKYWRRIPEISGGNTSENHGYLVVARITVVLQPLEGSTEILDISDKFDNEGET